VATVAAAAMVVLAGGLMASNMGFKLNYQLVGQAVGVSATGSQTIALPFNPQVGMTVAQHLMSDMALAPGTPQNLQKFLPTSDSFQLYTFGDHGGPNDFTLNPGEGYFVKVGADFNYIIVGSHDPSAVVTLNPSGVGGSATGSNLIAPPYHTTATNALELFQELGSAQNLQRFLPLTDSFELYDFSNFNNFAIQPGVAYFAKVGGGGPVGWQPSHY
jgi:hypothetical protein